MSISRAVARGNIRTMMMDTASQGGVYAVGDDILNLLINARVQDFLNAIPTGTFKSPSLVTLVSGTAFYSLGAAQPAYTAIGDIIYRARGRVLRKATRNEIERMRQGIQPASGFPQFAAVWEQSTDNTVQVAFWPTPGDSVIQTGTAVDIYVNTNRVNLALDSDLIFFQDPLIRAMEKAVAGEGIIMMPDAQRRVNVAVAQLWMSDYERMCKDESNRVSRMRAQRTPSVTIR